MSVLQTGSVSPGHLVSWTTQGIVQDAGSATTPGVNSLGIYGLGGKPLSITNLPYGGPPSGIYSQMNFGVSSTAGYINLDTFGTAALPLNLSINGTPVLSVTTAGPTFPTPVPVASGGTGLSATPTNGQLLIGNGTGYTLGTLTAGVGISVIDGAGTVTINATGTSAATLVIGTSPVTGGTVGEVLVVGAGNVLSQAATTGSGSVVLATSPTIVGATLTASPVLHGTITFAP
jgi:hypothetical protein